MEISWKVFKEIAFAREFVDGKTNEPYPDSGGFLCNITLKPLDFLMREFKKPMVIVALTVAMLFFSSIIFYSAATMALMCRIFPFLRVVHPHHVKAVLFAVSQITILGMGLRMMMRLSDDELIRRLHSRRLIPLSIGTVILDKNRAG